MFRSLILLTLSVVLVAPPAYGKKDPRTASATLTPEQTEILLKAFEREKETMRRVKSSVPVMQIYLQNMRPDPEMYEVPVSDQYSIARLAFSDAFSTAYSSRAAMRSGFFKGTFGYLASLPKSFHIRYPNGDFLNMLFVDPANFDMEHYEFTFVRRDFLGSVRTFVFDVRPKRGSATPNRFSGRIWVEDAENHVVRFHGQYGGAESAGIANTLSFDSWRTNVQSSTWLPTATYLERTGQGSSPGSTGLRAQIYFWGYSLKLPEHTQDNESIAIANAEDQNSEAADVSPLQAQRAWISQAEDSVLDRLTQAGLVAPPSDFDQLLETIANNVIIGSDVTLSEPIRCRVLLTSTLESLAVGNTIVVSKGLIDVAPSEEALAAVLSFQIAHIVGGHHINTRYAFNDRVLYPDDAAFQHVAMNHSAAENEAAGRKAVELFNHSIYAPQASNVGLFLQQMQAREKPLAHLFTPLIGDSLIREDGTLWLAGLMEVGFPKLDNRDLSQIAALPLNSRLRIDPWDDRVYMLNTRPTPILNARDKMPFEVTPVYYKLARYQPSGENVAAKAENGSNSQTTQSPSTIPKGSPPPPPPPSTASALAVPAFPWPPPRASAREVIPYGMIAPKNAHLRLGDVNHILVNALFANGYSDLSYFRTPGAGFVLVTRLEHIRDDGRPMPSGSRWSADQAISLAHFSLADYLKALFIAPPGYYRIMVFTITNAPFTEAKVTVKESEAQAWLEDGSNELPSFMADQQYDTDMVCTAFIYEFRMAADSNPPGPSPVLPSHLKSHDHLVNSGLWASLQEEAGSK